MSKTARGLAADFLVDSINEWAYERFQIRNLERQLRDAIPHVEREIRRQSDAIRTLQTRNPFACIYAVVRYRIRTESLPKPWWSEHDPPPPMTSVDGTPQVSIGTTYVDDTTTLEDSDHLTVHEYASSILLSSPADVLDEAVEGILLSVETLHAEPLHVGLDSAEVRVALGMVESHLRLAQQALGTVEAREAGQWLRRAADDLAFILQLADPLRALGTPAAERDDPSNPLASAAGAVLADLGAIMHALAGLQSLSCRTE